jgi:hypothetical protein
VRQLGLPAPSSPPRKRRGWKAGASRHALERPTRAHLEVQLDEANARRRSPSARRGRNACSPSCDGSARRGPRATRAFVRALKADGRLAELRSAHDRAASTPHARVAATPRAGTGRS